MAGVDTIEVMLTESFWARLISVRSASASESTSVLRSEAPSSKLVIGWTPGLDDFSLSPGGPVIVISGSNRERTLYFSIL